MCGELFNENDLLAEIRLLAAGSFAATLYADSDGKVNLTTKAAEDLLRNILASDLAQYAGRKDIVLAAFGLPYEGSDEVEEDQYGWPV
jgi:hypothetical protein